MSSTDRTEPLRILIGCDTFAPDVNGAARFTERLAAGLVARGHRVFIVAPSQKYRRTPPRTEVIEGQPMTVYRLPAVRWLPHDWLRFVWPWRSKHYARRVLGAVQPDVVHIQSHIVIGRGLARIARQRRIPIVATNHVMAENILDFTVMPPFIDQLVLKLAWDDAERTFKMARAVTTPTRRAADFLERTVDLKGVIPISCGIDRANYRPDPEPRDRSRLLFVGRLTSEKRVDVTLRAIARIVDEHRPAEGSALDLRFDIVGGGDQRKHLEHLVERLGLQDRVTFHGRV
ncbi:MAG: glycosyltransferase, partial [Leucobacter sp.]